MHRLMELASRPGGALSRDVAASLGTPKKCCDITKQAQRLQLQGWITEVSTTREGRVVLSRSCTTPALFAQWSSEHPVSTKPRKHVPGPSMTVSIRAQHGHAWWDKTAQPGQPGYVEPVITADTKVTVCPSFSDHPKWSNTHLRSA
jgi:hypothetical protein